MFHAALGPHLAGDESSPVFRTAMAEWQGLMSRVYDIRHDDVQDLGRDRRVLLKNEDLPANAEPLANGPGLKVLLDVM